MNIRTLYHTGCSLPNSMLSGRRSRQIQLSIQHFIKSGMLLVTCERTCCHKVLICVANTFLSFDWR